VLTVLEVVPLAVVVEDDVPEELDEPEDEEPEDEEPEEDDPEDEERPDEPPLSAMAGALARASIKVAAERARVVRRAFMVCFLCVDDERLAQLCVIFPTHNCTICGKISHRNMFCVNFSHKQVTFGPWTVPPPLSPARPPP